MKNRKKLAKGVVALSMVLSFGGVILAPTHEAVASGGECPGGGVKVNGFCPNSTYNRLEFCCEGSPTNCVDFTGGC